MTSDRTFQCPNCGSPLMTSGADKEIKCPYCGSTVIVPKELRESPQPQPAPGSYGFPTTSRAGYQSLQDMEADSSTAQGASFSTSGFSGGRLVLPLVIAVISIVVAAGVGIFLFVQAGSATRQADQAFSPANAPFPTAAPSPTPIPTQPIPTPVPFAKVLFKDEFSSVSTGWPRARNPKYTLEYKGGSYHILINEQGQGQEVTAAGEKTYADASIEVDVQQTAGPSDGLMGVTCRNDGNGNFYSFEFSQDGTYGIFKYSKDSGDALDEETLAPNSVNQKDVNHVEGVCQGDTLTLLLNGKVLSQVQDSDYTKGATGLLVRTGSSGDAGEDVLFSHLVVKGP